MWQADVLITVIAKNDYMLIDSVFGPPGTVVYIMGSMCSKMLRLVHVAPVGDKGAFFSQILLGTAFSVCIDQPLLHNHRSLPLIIVSNELCPQKTNL